ncbi:flagellin [Kyrpidia spormannii]|uniref:Flagellin n=1 Tax=Kyrpidia spormannii TaxID=2055160 RepID=A0A2K8NBP2_9BACL|nr:flagellin [Kyrpidia spormannii]ATY86020.1 flagellin [Kyrpidia spormannii]
MIINHNLAALNAWRQLSINNTETQKSLEKLSSGYRINRAGDDAAGLAISEKMRGQISGLDQATRNAQDGISLIQTAEGALNETSSILQRMRELAVQASNDTNTQEDRNAIQQEITQLKSEINRISTTTQFNTKNLLDGTIGNSAVLSNDNLKLKSVQVVDANLAADTYTVKNVAAATVGADIKTNTTGLTAANFDFTDTTKVSGLALGDYTLTVTQGATAGTYDLTLQDKNGVTVASATGWDPTSADATLKGSVNGVSTTFTIKKGATPQAGTMTFNLNATYAAAGDFTITNSSNATVYKSAASLKITDSNFQAGGFQFNMTVDTALAAAGTTTTITTTNNALTMHIGANENQTMKVAVSKMDTTSLGIDNIDVTTQAGAEAAITAIDNATQMVSTERAKLGAYQNRLEHTINNLSTSSQNITSAESRIRDVDMAQEMMNFTKNNILQQAATAMLAQANQQPQLVLQLLR